MTINEELKARADDINLDAAAAARTLTVLADYLVAQAQNHLKQVIVQHPEFDLHDATHSAAVVKNIEDLLGVDGIKARTNFELFLLISSAYLHDCAMAVPEWELNLFRLTEGATQSFRNVQSSVSNDLETSISFKDAKLLVLSRREDIFGSYENAGKWIFSTKSEVEFIDDLVTRLRDYQEFRNGYAAELRELTKDPDGFRQRSEQIRQEFLRYTHWLRIETWVHNLDTLFEERLGGLWGKALAHDLASVCRSHGEGIEYVRALTTRAVYVGGSQSDLRLVALMLRLGDVIHFTPDRAPLILFRQKLISSPISRQHWEVKNQGIGYSIVNIPESGTTVRYSAYFQSPRLYFLFQEYLDSVDREFALYDDLTRRERDYAASRESRLIPTLSASVDRVAVRFDPSRFQPVPGLRFHLNQRRILDLLMGVKLYKDRFACLRELYQNALDACRCMLAASGDAAPRGLIEFGIGIDESTKERFLFCHDNGIGMTKDIVSRYLLQIGNSFYRSQEFQRLVTRWRNPFTPVSQFGIGILSCFMVAKRLEIVSKPLRDLAETNETICFMIDGPHEHFYYKPPNVADVEQLGAHGTLVKLFLTEEIEVSDSAEADIAFLQHTAKMLAHDSPLAAEAKAWESHLYRHVSSFVAQYPPKIRVAVRVGDGRSVDLLRATTPFDYRALGISRERLEIAAVAERRFQIVKSDESYLDVVDQVVTKEVVVDHEGIGFSCIINFPRRGFRATVRALPIVNAISMSHGVLVDGISVGEGILPLTMDVMNSLARVGVLNFGGRHRPPLSVDRMSVVEWPKWMEEVVAPIGKLLTSRLIDEVALHSSREGFDAESPELCLLWEFVFSRFGFLAGDLIEAIVKGSEVTVPHRELSSITDRAATIRHFVDAPSITVNLGNYHILDQTTKLLLFAKLTSAKNIRVDGDKIIVAAGKFTPLANCRDWDHFRERQYVFSADEWSGTFGSFDIVSALWPIIPSRLFEKLDGRHGGSVSINGRTKCVHQYGNSFGAISALDPLLVHPRLGTYCTKSLSFLEEKPTSNVYRFEEARNNFWLHDVGQPGDTPEDQRVYPFLTAFIAPRALTEQETKALVRYRSEDAEYVKGVESGWSILFTGQKDHNSVCLPGVKSRCELIAAIPETFWVSHIDKRFAFLDGETPKPNIGTQ